MQQSYHIKEIRMTMLIKAMLALFWLLIVPTAAGIPFLKKKKDRTVSDCFFAGYLFFFSVSELLTLPMTYGKAPLHLLVWCSGFLFLGMAAYGIFCLVKQRRSYRAAQHAADASETGLSAHEAAASASEADFPAHEAAADFHAEIREKIRNASPFFWCALILIAVQMLIVVLYAHFDADDAFYVAAATTAVHTDSIFAFDPYTGYAARSLPSRYVLSPFPIFLAVISQLCNGLHPAITAHTIFPPVFQLLAYTAIYQIGRRWFPKSSHGRGIFLFCAATLNSFFTYSVYNVGSFQMIRIWQGKALLAAALLPLLLYLSLSTIMEKTPKYPWKLLLMANLSCCLLSSMGIILAPLMQGIFVMLNLLRFRSSNTRHALFGLLCCIPSLLLGAVYLFAL